jgi:SAM-dependent methyltransferase
LRGLRADLTRLRAAEKARLYSLGAAYRLGLYHRGLRHGLTPNIYAELMDYRRAAGQQTFPLDEFPARLAAANVAWQSVDIARSVSDADHFAAWKSPAAREYVLLWSAAKLSRYPLTAQKWLPDIPAGSRICEYGAGAAPVAHAVRRFYMHKRFRITIADIPSESFKFAKHVFRDAGWVEAVDIHPDNDEPLTDVYDAVFCITVFEHLPRSLNVARHLHDRLRPGGTLVFDYLQTEARGVDTLAAVKDRPLVFAFLRERFAGTLNENEPGQFVLTKT